MNTNPQKNSIDRVLEKIQNNELRQKPKSYFRLRFVALIVVAVAVLVVSVFFASFIIFSVEASGQASLFQFGLSGWEVFLLLFPWKLAILEAMLIVGLEWLLRSFSFGYKIPVLYLLAAVFAVMLISGVIVDVTPLHGELLAQADQHHLPPALDDFYEGARIPPPPGHNIFRGQIVSVATSTFMMALDNPAGLGTTTVIEVVILPGEDTNDIHAGERVFVEGELIDGTLHAHDVRDTHDMAPPDQPEQLPPPQQ